MRSLQPTPRRASARAATGVVALTLALGLAACASVEKKKLEARYAPSESVLEVVAVLRRHVPDDTYRFPAATDFTGRNVYRSSLLRLESLEQIHADALRSGYMDPVIAFAKARALERLRAFDLAAGHYREAARFASDLREPAEKSALLCQQIAKAVATGIELVSPLSGDSTRASLPTDATQVLAELDERVALLSLLMPEAAGSHYEFILREEIERADEVRAHYFVATRFSQPDGTLRALSELQRLVQRHGPSKRRLLHMLALANFYSELAREYVAAAPPESLHFDPAAFQDLVDPATQVYEAVASQDGTPEKLEAARRLEAFLAFTLQVDRDRFSR